MYNLSRASMKILNIYKTGYKVSYINHKIKSKYVKLKMIS